MDPALLELISEDLDPNEEIEALIRLVKRNEFPPGIRVVTQFGEIISCRVRRGDVRTVYDNPAVASFKAPRLFYHDTEEEENGIDSSQFFNEEEAALVPTGNTLTGRGVVVGIIDWGCDFAHADFVNADGTTRIMTLWDQGADRNALSPEPFRYGKVYDRQHINLALRTATPYATLGYHPGTTDPQGRGMHGTHVMGIATANGRTAHKGMAPEAEIIFVHLAGSETDGRFNLGDSVRIVEAIDFVKRTAGNRPLVMNLSVGKHGGPHDGRTLIEMGIDSFLEENSNTVLCQSTGNYFNSKTHCSGLITPSGSEKITFRTARADVAENEIEIWYSGKDEFAITLQHGESTETFSCNLDAVTEIKKNGTLVGTMYHRSKEPNNGLNNVDIFLYPGAPIGEWHLRIEGKKITDGRFHSWIERVNRGQSNFLDANIIHTSTTNTICNSNNSIVVGAYNQSDPTYSIAPFSSSGPTLDGRLKPHILAPGINITSAKSSAPGLQTATNQLIAMSGTSMASPCITGVVALILQGINRVASIHDIRNILFRCCTQVERNAKDKDRSGYGILDLSKLSDSIEWFNRQQHHVTPAKHLENVTRDYAPFENVTWSSEHDLYECGNDFREDEESEESQEMVFQLSGC
ncbi:MAG TPA: S8 family peptidase [Chitinophagales bacterium]|nr:S8 family peptidase [Chitinophagales bacterium]